MTQEASIDQNKVHIPLDSQNVQAKKNISPEIILVITLITCTVHGIWRSQGLIDKAKVDELGVKILKVQKAISRFSEEYKGFPGDFAYASTHIDFSLQNGNQNGKIDTNREREQVWPHLVLSGLLETPVLFSGQFTHSILKADSCSIGECLSNGLGSGMKLSFSNISQSFTHKDNELWLGGNITPTILKAVDTAIDDGKPLTGKIRVSNTSDCVQNKAYNVKQAKAEAPKNSCHAIYRFSPRIQEQITALQQE